MIDRGPPVQLYTGTCWYFLDPRPEDVHFDDMIGLARITRYLGATIEPYVVAEHCYLGARELMARGHDRRTCLGFLLHDPEYIPPADVSGPVVQHLEKREAKIREILPDYEDETLRIRRMGERAVWEAFGVLDVLTGDGPESRAIWEMDRIMLATECRDIMGPSDVDRGPLPDPLPVPIIPWRPDVAWREFCCAFDALGGRRLP